MKCVIIGAAGFIGRFLGTRLVRGGAEVLGLDAATVVLGDLGFALRRCDVVRDAPEIPAGTDAVYYLAQFPHYRSFPEGAGNLYAVNVAGALRAADAASAAGARLFCYASTGSVYRPAFAALREDHPVRRDAPYPLSKVAAEEALALVPGPMRCVCVRLFGVFGPGQRDRLVPGITTRLLRGDPVTLEPPGTDGLRISLTFVEDVAECLAKLASVAPDALPRVLNVAAPEPVAVRDLAHAAAEILGVEPRFEPARRPRDGDLVADISRLAALLRPTFTPWRDGLAATLGAARAAELPA